MLNQEMRSVSMRRADMLRVQQALTSMVVEFRREANDPDTTETRREIAEKSMKMWWRIRNEFERQIKEQDPEEYK